MEIEFDSAKDQLIRALHKLSLAGAKPIFDNFRIDYEDERQDYGETRFLTWAASSEQSLCVFGRPGEIGQESLA